MSGQVVLIIIIAVTFLVVLLAIAIDEPADPSDERGPVTATTGSDLEDHADSAGLPPLADPGHLTVERGNETQDNEGDLYNARRAADVPQAVDR